MNKIVAAMLGALALAQAGTASAQPQPVQGADPAIWQGEAAAGTIVHRATNVSLPFELQGLRRVRVSSIADTDVAATYELRDGASETRLTVFLFRPGALPEHRLRGSLAAFGTVSPTAFVWATGPFDVAGPRPLHGYKGTFKTGIGPGTVMDYLYFFELGGWTVKVRATLSGEQGFEHEARIDAFVRALPWDQILAANGDCSGAACSLPAFEAIDSHFMQTRLGPLLFSRTRFDERQEAGLPVAARAEIPLMGQADIRRSDGEPLLYVTSVPQLATYRLLRVPDVANQLLTEAFGRISVSKPVYALVIRIGGADLMPRLFHGEPTPEAFAQAVSNLVINEMPGQFVTVAQAARDMPE